MACLTLVAPSGMTAEDRKAWVQVARHTLSGIPADLLATGCKKARETCRFASEIVPTIMETVGPMWESRKAHYEMEKWRFANRNAPKVGPSRRLERVAISREITQQILRDVKLEIAKDRGEA